MRSGWAWAPLRLRRLLAVVSLSLQKVIKSGVDLYELCYGLRVSATIVTVELGDCEMETLPASVGPG